MREEEEVESASAVAEVVEQRESTLGGRKERR